jgi:REP element-mobilizing transposase RayT
MCSLFRNQFRIESARLAGHDYSSPGKYYITICVKNQIPFFGKIANGKMILNDIGIIADKFWLEIPHHYQNIKLDEYIIMPDHIHGIIIINPNPSIVQTPNLGVSSSESSPDSVETPNLGVSTPESSPKHMETPNLGVSTEKLSPAKNPKWKSNSIGSIINQYKRICTLNIKLINRDFEWHPRFHDRVIRNNRELNCIRKYIKNNPSKWNT